MATFSALRGWFPDRRDPVSYLQVTGHPERRVVTLSHWHDRVCLASTAMDIDDVPELVSILTIALARSASVTSTPAENRPLRAIAVERLRDRWRRPEAHIVELFSSAVGRASRARGGPNRQRKRAG